MIFDTHAHYDDEAFEGDREELLAGLQENGIEAAVNVSASMEGVERTLELIRKWPCLYGAVGVHPNETGELNEEKISRLKEASREPKVVAVGEIGLDYYWDQPEREVQKRWFIRQLELAREVKLPVIIHSRDAAKDTLDIMKEQKAGEIGGVIHCFSYGTEMAREYLNMGFFIGIGGVLTFRNGKKLKEVAAFVPMDRIVLETDCPYLSPVPNRGKRNSSLNLPYVVAELARIREISEEEVIQITSQNARRLYRLREQ